MEATPVARTPVSRSRRLADRDHRAQANLVTISLTPVRR